MSTSTRLAVVLALVLVATGAVFLGRLAWDTREASLPPRPLATVPAAWHDVRNAPGHVVHVGAQGIECKKCHDVDRGFSKPNVSVCAPCHAHEARMQHALTALETADVFTGVADCLACHAFGAAREDRLWNCAGCHGEPQGKLDPISVHGDVACSECHHPHADPATEHKACVTCHVMSEKGASTMKGAAPASHAMKSVSRSLHHDVRFAHGGKPIGSAGTCLDCHSPHADAKRANERCQHCHDDKPHALFSGHDQCKGCHAPHAFSRDQVVPCRSCHENQHVLAESSAEAHRNCTSCHDPHARAVSDATCERCHKSVSPRHPKTGDHECVGCHVPHPKTAQASPAQACTTCHGFADGDHDAHGGRAACTNCHQPHAFAHPQQGVACTQCHADQLAAIAKNAGHAQCLGCHRGSVHAAKISPIACTSCHATVHPRQGHEHCTKCHEPHSGSPRKASESCVTCHEKEQHGKVPEHRACLTCHTPHDGGKLKVAECKGCHEPKTKQNHGALAGGCTPCHGMHSDAGVRAAPACTSCHDPTKLPGLHAAQAHQNCVSCHGGAHDTGPWSERATCVTCHKAQQNHVPEAQFCQGCHVFRK